MTDTPITRFRKALLRAVGPMLVSHGFSARARGQSFYRPLSLGRASLHLSFIPHAQFDIHVTADVAVRFDAVEELVHSCDVPESDRRATATLGRELGNIRDGCPIRWVVSEDDDVPQTAHSIVETFREIGIPYLERYSNPDQALAVLSRNDVEGWRHMPVHDARCKRAVAMAFVLGRHELVEHLIRQSEKYLATLTDFELSGFVEFVARLRNIQGSRGAST